MLSFVLSASRRRCHSVIGNAPLNRKVFPLRYHIFIYSFDKVSFISNLLHSPTKLEINVYKLLSETDTEIFFSSRDGVMYNLKMIEVKFRAALNEKTVAQFKSLFG
jgi:hypothetical protein